MAEADRVQVRIAPSTDLDSLEAPYPQSESTDKITGLSCSSSSKDWTSGCHSRRERMGALR